MADKNARISSTGRAYPEGVLTNADLEKLVETSDDYSDIALLGNTSPALFPIALDTRVERGRLSEGYLVLCASFGCGVTYGARS